MNIAKEVDRCISIKQIGVVYEDGSYIVNHGEFIDDCDCDCIGQHYVCPHGVVCESQYTRESDCKYCAVEKFV